MSCLLRMPVPHLPEVGSGILALKQRLGSLDAFYYNAFSHDFSPIKILHRRHISLAHTEGGGYS